MNLRFQCRYGGPSIASSMLCLGIIVCACRLTAAQDMPPSTPELPRVYTDTTLPISATYCTVTLTAGADIQAALNNASLGDTICLQSGATFYGNFVLPAKTLGAGWITIRSTRAAELPEGVRVRPEDAPKMAKLVSANSQPVFRSRTSSHHYRLIGLELTVTWTGRNGNDYSSIIEAGDIYNEDSLSNVSHHLIFDRLYVHGNPYGAIRRGLALNAAHTAVIDSYFSEFHSDSSDSQAILSWSNPGPTKITNNYLEAAGENYMCGGATPKNLGWMCDDTEVRFNYFHKPLRWKADEPTYVGIQWSVKNLFELKTGRRMLIEGNIFENNWVQAQAGRGIVLTVRALEGKVPTAVIEDITFRKNIVRNTPEGFNILGKDDTGDRLGQAQRIAIRDNVIENINVYINSSYGGAAFIVTNGAKSVTIDHNTILAKGTGIAKLRIEAKDPYLNENIVFTNNIMPGGIFASGQAEGIPSLACCVKDNSYFVTRNVLSRAAWASYPAGNLQSLSTPDPNFASPNNGLDGDYHLVPGSPYRNAGTDGKDLGAEIDAVSAATSGVRQGTPGNNTPISLIDATPPTIAELKTTAITGSGVTITWFTDEPSDTQIECLASSKPSVTQSRSVLETFHSVALSGLSPGTTYIATLTSRDATGNAATASVTFTTMVAYDPNAPWLDRTWSSRRPVTVSSSKVSGSTSLQNFPVLIRIASPDLRSVLNSGQVAHANGSDVVFTAGDGTTRLPFELERYDPTTGEIIAWVSIPTLSSTADTHLFVYYGNGNSLSTQPAFQVWDEDFQIVQHFGTPNADATTIDSTSYGNNGKAGAGARYTGAGAIGGSYTFDGSSTSSITIPNNVSWAANRTGFTLEAWVKMDEWSNYRGAVAVGKWEQGISSMWTSSTGQITFNLLTMGGLCSQSMAVPKDGGYHYLAMTFDGSAFYPYVDGKKGSYRACGGTTTLGTAPLSIGGFVGNSNKLLGSVDEVRLSTSARSDDWIKTSYTNYSDPAGFATLGSAQSSAATGQESVSGTGGSSNGIVTPAPPPPPPPPPTTTTTTTTASPAGGANGSGNLPATRTDAPTPLTPNSEPSRPSVASLQPLTGSGVSGTFTAVFTHSRGASELYLGYILFLPTANVVSYTARGSCLIEYNRISNGMRLIDNAGTGWLGGESGISLGTPRAVLTNNQCTVNVQNVTASLGPNTMTVTVPITFKNTLSPTLGTFLQAADIKNNWTGMTQFGNWTLPSGTAQPGPSITRVASSTTTGSSAVYVIGAGHTGGVSALSMIHLLISNRILGGSSCQAIYFPSSNTLNLINDAGTQLISSSGVVPGTPGSLANSRCSINTSQASRAVTGNVVTVAIPMSYQPGTFGGSKNVYVNVFDNNGLLTHWVHGTTMTVQ